MIRIRFAHMATGMGMILAALAAPAQSQEKKPEGTKTQTTKSKEKEPEETKSKDMESEEAKSDDTDSNDDDAPDRESRDGGSVDDRSEVADLVRMIDKGQLRLSGAIEIAERHTKGRAVSASVEMDRNRIESDNEVPQSGDDRLDKKSKKETDKHRGTKRAKSSKDRADDAQSGGTSKSLRSQDQAIEDISLNYEVVCYADGKLIAVGIDGQTRKVTRNQIRDTLDSDSNPQASSEDRRDSGTNRRDEDDEDDQNNGRDDDRDKEPAKSSQEQPEDQSKDQPKDQPKDTPLLPKSKP